MNRRLRSSAALLAIAAMLFAPLAMALHACPLSGDMAAAAQTVAVEQAAAASMDMAACARPREAGGSRRRALRGIPACPGARPAARRASGPVLRARFGGGSRPAVPPLHRSSHLILRSD
jgi:hypothetical protein